MLVKNRGKEEKHGETEFVIQNGENIGQTQFSGFLTQPPHSRFSLRNATQNNYDQECKNSSNKTKVDHSLA